MKIAALVSGGVDSTVALQLAREQGHNIQAFYLKVWMEDDTTFGDCAWQEDLEYVHKVCDQLDVKVNVLSMQREYWDRVVNYTLKMVNSGLTPNPDVMCNKLVKFGAFYDKAGYQFDRIMTGHWAKSVQDSNGYTHLMLAKDRFKDQTYFLSQMSYEQSSRTYFPLSELTKADVRKIAAAQKFANAQRKDSQGICFLGKINYRQFLNKYLGEKRGLVINHDNGETLGEHAGYWFYTIGQRQGLGLSGGPWFVVEKNAEENIIYVTRGYDPELVYRSLFTIDSLNWIFLPEDIQSKLANGESVDIQFKIRHTPELSFGSMRYVDEQLEISSATKLHGVAPGQFAAIYLNDECLGSGVIV